MMGLREETQAGLRPDSPPCIHLALEHSLDAEYSTGKSLFACASDLKGAL